MQGDSSERHVSRPKRRSQILAIDIGGTSVKLRVSNRRAIASFDSSKAMSPRELVKRTRQVVRNWQFHFVTVGYPGMVIDGRIVSEPANLAHGWVGFDFEKAFGRPTRILNDAVMQAVGSYEGGRMLFLGFGTAMGAVAILNSKIFPMELAHLPFSKRGSVQNSVGGDALRRLGKKRWSANAKKLVNHLSEILDVHYVVLGGGNARRIVGRPKNARVGDNALAFKGGFRAWRGRIGGRILDH